MPRHELGRCDRPGRGSPLGGGSGTRAAPCRGLRGRVEAEGGLAQVVRRVERGGRCGDRDVDRVLHHLVADVAFDAAQPEPGRFDWPRAVTRAREAARILVPIRSPT